MSSPASLLHVRRGLDVAHLGLRQVAALQAAHVVDQHVHDPLAALQPAVGDHQRLAAHGQAAALVHRRGHDQVERAVLVLEQHERDALGGGRALAGDHQPGDRDRRAVADRSEVGAGDRVPRQVGAHQLHRVLVQRDAGRAVVGQQPVPRARARRSSGASWRSSGSASWVPALPPTPTGTPGAATPSSHSAWRRRPSSGPSTSAVARPRPGELAQRVDRTARPRGEILDRPPRRPPALLHQRPNLGLPHPVHVPQPHPNPQAHLRSDVRGLDASDTQGGSTSMPRRCASCTSASDG